MRCEKLRTRARGDLVTLESGPQANPYRHARLRHVTVQYWQLEMPSHTKWESTPFRAVMDEIVKALVENFGWTLQPRD